MASRCLMLERKQKKIKDENDDDDDDDDDDDQIDRMIRFVYSYDSIMKNFKNVTVQGPVIHLPSLSS